MDELSQRIRRLSKGIHENRVSDADILSIAIQSSTLKKRKMMEEAKKVRFFHNVFFGFNRYFPLGAGQEDQRLWQL
jgi:hypothetical protein